MSYEIWVRSYGLGVIRVRVYGLRVRNYGLQVRGLELGVGG